MPTGSAVVADVVDIARNIIHGSINRVPSLSYRPENIVPGRITPMTELRCPYYFRISALDKPGVLSTLAGILGKHGISIESVLQKVREKGGTVPVVIRTYEASESSVQAALAEIDSLDICPAKTVKIRILQDDEHGED
jgi:homoserine dehydrogenase